MWWLWVTLALHTLALCALWAGLSKASAPGDFCVLQVPPGKPAPGSKP